MMLLARLLCGDVTPRPPISISCVGLPSWPLKRKDGHQDELITRLVQAKRYR
ncbi:hypothetical protein DAEQUDRAFT_734063 [Daedalea quercina L-15889]|uniref:Uncharacterized protein n=1 Tax=Daedalea quercina L-15889 TaxID=1314783 RepID=A0A165KH10_9APHY|nr:hypothetical protein DAEQUDRAFT_734183 [Daedalea quercina L-15889]KZT63228.1 hypothetical protein DAEQUDRAFT_734063 [Daedalea quercina L-15889]